MPRTPSIYVNRDPRTIPTYTYAQASRIINVPAATLRAWVAGTTYSGGTFEPVINPPDPKDIRLSFLNLIEGSCPPRSPN